MERERELNTKRLKELSPPVQRVRQPFERDPDLQRQELPSDLQEQEDEANRFYASNKSGHQWSWLG